MSMSTTTLRHYKTAFSYQKTDRVRRIQEMKKRFRTRMSRRRFKQGVRSTLHKFNLA